MLVTYEFLELSYRGIRDLEGKVEKFRAGHGKEPHRASSALYYRLWVTLNLPIKRVVFDECQRVKNAYGARHKAMRELFHHSVILMFGTIVDNNWPDLAALFLYLP